MADTAGGHWYTINNIETIDSPTLVFYKQRIERNIQVLLSMIDQPERLRPHVKTHKTQEASLLLIEAGVKKFKCATIAEAEMLAMVKAPDVLLAYQPVGPKLKRLISLIKKYGDTGFSCLIDNFMAAKAIADEAVANGLIIPVYIDINAGMNRTGISPNRAEKLFEEVVALGGIRIMGLHIYDGHIRTLDMAQRTKEVEAAFSPIEDVKKALTKKGYDNLIIIAGGTPTFPIHAKRKEVEVSPGTFILWDKGYQSSCPEQNFEPAALVVSRVISLPDKSKVCLDLGHKSIASENEIGKRVFFINAPELKLVGHSEEHLVAEAGHDHFYSPGDVLYGIPYHICPTCALYERALVVQDKEVVDEWRIISRDRKISI